jgi:hypothetical protein
MQAVLVGDSDGKTQMQMYSLPVWDILERSNRRDRSDALYAYVETCSSSTQCEGRLVTSNSDIQ